MLRRAIHLIIALALTAVGSAEFVYLYFFAEAPRGWITLAAGVMGCAGLYWPWDEYINAGRPRDRTTEDCDGASIGLGSVALSSSPRRPDPSPTFCLRD
jgi:hypothetical protein